MTDKKLQEFLDSIVDENLLFKFYDDVYISLYKNINHVGCFSKIIQFLIDNGYQCYIKSFALSELSEDNVDEVMINIKDDAHTCLCFRAACTTFKYLYDLLTEEQKCFLTLIGYKTN